MSYRGADGDPCAKVKEKMVEACRRPEKQIVDVLGLEFQQAEETVKMVRLAPRE